MSEEQQLTSSDIFYQFCQAKPDESMKFISDYILYLLEVPVDFDNELYGNFKQYIFDFMIGCDMLFKFFYSILSLPKEEITKEKFISSLEKEFELENENLDNFYFGVFMSNLDKFYLLKAKETSDFDSEEIKNYKLNIQMDFGNSNISHLENEFKVLMKVDKKNNQTNYFEVDEKELGSLISKLKDIYCQIKS